MGLEVIYIHRSKFIIKNVKRCLACKAIIMYKFDIHNQRLLNRIARGDADIEDGEFVSSQIPCNCEDKKIEKIEKWCGAAHTEEEIDDYYARKTRVKQDCEYELFNDEDD